MTTLIARLLFIPVTAFFLAQTIYIFERAVFSLIPFEMGSPSGIHEKLAPLAYFLTGVFVIWLLLLFIGEILSFRRITDFRFQRTLRNLRYAPIAALVFSGLITIFFDSAMIEFSKYRIRSYVFDGAQSLAFPDFSLHNNYRHWCGNGASAQMNYLYFEIAAEGIADPDPYVRSRSLLMASRVQDWINGGDERFAFYLANACRDSDSIFRGAAENYLQGERSSCEKYLSAR